MQTYLVGGAVRDQLLNLPVNERDWVVTGASVEDMLALGYKQVGKDFPVFIHPTSGDEYALARTERKTSKGHSGFIVHSSPEITLQEDLLRRDLTINAIAQDENGNLIDPYNGQKDLHNRLLRHISPAFSEDPLRVLRVARFAAKFKHLGFKIDASTLQIMQNISESSELQTLSVERIWQETIRGLETENPEIYFLTLLNCGALQVLQPELARELSDRSKQSLLARLDKISGGENRYVALVALASYRSRNFSIDIVKQINKFFSVPRNLQELSMLAIENFCECTELQTLTNKKIHALLKRLDVYRRNDRCQRIFKGMQSISVLLEFNAMKVLNFLQWLSPQLEKVKIPAQEMQYLDGKEIAKKLDEQRYLTIEELRSRYFNSKHE